MLCTLRCLACEDCAAGSYRVGCGGLTAGTCNTCQVCTQGFYLQGCGGQRAGACISCADTPCPSGMERVGCEKSSPGTCIKTWHPNPPPPVVSCSMCTVLGSCYSVWDCQARVSRPSSSITLHLHQAVREDSMYAHIVWCVACCVYLAEPFMFMYQSSLYVCVCALHSCAVSLRFCAMFCLHVFQHRLCC